MTHAPTPLSTKSGQGQWRQKYFGLLDTTNSQSCALCDPDHDGMSNWQEFIAGTDPTNNASAFRIISVVPVGNNMRVTWQMGAGKTNALQAANKLTGNFADISTVTNTTGSVTNYLDLGGATNRPSRYYRVRVLSP
jgi:hypothetical protein